MSLIMEGLKRAQQLRMNSLGDEPASASQPRLPKEDVSSRRKRWLFGTTGLIGLFILIFFLGGFSSPRETGRAGDSVSSPQYPDLPSLRPAELLQGPIQPARGSQPPPASQRQTAASFPKDSSPHGQVLHLPSVREIPPTDREQGHAVKPSAESGREEVVPISASRPEDRGEPQDLVLGRPEGRPLDRALGPPSESPLAPDSGEFNRTDQIRVLDLHPTPDIPAPALKAEPSENRQAGLKEYTDAGEKAAPLASPSQPPLPSAPPSRKALQEAALPVEEKISARPIDVRQETRRETSPTSEALRQFNHAVALHQRRETSRAIEAYRKAIELNPASVEAYNNLGLLLQERGEMDQAQQAYQKSIEIAPGYVKAYNNLGVLFLLRGREDQALDFFQKALTIDPNHYESHLHLGVLYRKQGRIQKAIESYQRALSLQPAQAEAYYNLGLLYEQLENVDSAVRHYRKFTQMASNTYPDLVSRVQRHMDRLLKKQTGKNRE